MQRKKFLATTVAATAFGAAAQALKAQMPATGRATKLFVVQAGASRFGERTPFHGINPNDLKVSGRDTGGALAVFEYAGLSVEQLASAACLSVKQYYRKSVERLGVGPKLFGRITRFDQAIKQHPAHLAHDWLSVALAAGYHDYQHLVRDFKNFTARTPACFAQQENQAPERVFGLVET